jgi:hypothetical protein
VRFVPVLYDANGYEVYEGGLTRSDIVAAIQAAALAGEFATAQEIADRHGWTGICLNCALKSAVRVYYDRMQAARRVCMTCFHDLDDPDPDSFTGVMLYTHGLMRRDVQ